MYCRKCGKLIPNDSEYCQFCGEKIIGFNGGARNKEPIQNSPKGKTKFLSGKLIHKFGKLSVSEAEKLPHFETSSPSHILPFGKILLWGNALAFIIILLLVYIICSRIDETVTFEHFIIYSCIWPILLFLLYNSSLHLYPGEVYSFRCKGLHFVCGLLPTSRENILKTNLLRVLVFGLLPYALGLISNRFFCLGLTGAIMLGTCCLNLVCAIIIAVTVPANAYIYSKGINDYWFIPSIKEEASFPDEVKKLSVADIGAAFIFILIVVALCLLMNKL